MLSLFVDNCVHMNDLTVHKIRVNITTIDSRTDLVEFRAVFSFAFGAAIFHRELDESVGSS